MSKKKIRKIFDFTEEENQKIIDLNSRLKLSPNFSTSIKRIVIFLADHPELEAFFKKDAMLEYQNLFLIAQDNNIEILKSLIKKIINNAIEDNADKLLYAIQYSLKDEEIKDEILGNEN